jgi:hypothetical protein
VCVYDCVYVCVCVFVCLSEDVCVCMLRALLINTLSLTLAFCHQPVISKEGDAFLNQHTLKP